MEEQLTCVGCGAEFPASQATCKVCEKTMHCEGGTCMCEDCGHKQPADQMWCAKCLHENAAA